MAKAIVLAVLTNIPKTFIKNSSTQCQFTDYFGQVHLLNTGNSGVGGIDTGVVTLSTFYYVYKVATGIIASLSSSAPTGYTSGYQKIGAFYTDTANLVFKSYSFGEITRTSLTAKWGTSGIVARESDDFINGNATITGTSNFVFVFNAGHFSLTPNVVATTIFVTGQRLWQVTAESETGVEIRTGNSSGTDVQIGGQMICHKSGVDAIQPIW